MCYPSCHFVCFLNMAPNDSHSILVPNEQELTKLYIRPSCDNISCTHDQQSARYANNELEYSLILPIKLPCLFRT